MLFKRILTAVFLVIVCTNYSYAQNDKIPVIVEPRGVTSNWEPGRELVSEIKKQFDESSEFKLVEDKDIFRVREGLQIVIRASNSLDPDETEYSAHAVLNLITPKSHPNAYFYRLRYGHMNANHKEDIRQRGEEIYHLVKTSMLTVKLAQ